MWGFVGIQNAPPVTFRVNIAGWILRADPLLGGGVTGISWARSAVHLALHLALHLAFTVHLALHLALADRNFCDPTFRIIPGALPKLPPRPGGHALIPGVPQNYGKRTWPGLGQFPIEASAFQDQFSREN